MNNGAYENGFITRAKLFQKWKYLLYYQYNPLKIRLRLYGIYDDILDFQWFDPIEII